jgi:hypothetical protein
MHGIVIFPEPVPTFILIVLEGDNKPGKVLKLRIGCGLIAGVKVEPEVEPEVEPDVEELGLDVPVRFSYNFCKLAEISINDSL